MAREPARGAWRRAALVLGLSVLFPGAAHAYLGQPIRGILWSAIFLALVFPALLFGYVVSSCFSTAALYWLLLGLLLFGLLCGAGPLWLVLRSAPGASARPPAPAAWRAKIHGALTSLGVAAEIAIFLGTFLGFAKVETSSLEPIVPKGATVTLVVAPRYIRPLYRDIVLFEAEPERAEGLPIATRLGIVLARPGDSVDAALGDLKVDGVSIDLAREDLRETLESAAIHERHLRMFRVFRSIGSLLSTGPGPRKAVPGGRMEWFPSGPESYELPPEIFLILADEEKPPPAAVGSPSPFRFISRASILGRRVE